MQARYRPGRPGQSGVMPRRSRAVRSRARASRERYRPYPPAGRTTPLMFTPGCPDVMVRAASRRHRAASAPAGITDRHSSFRRTPGTANVNFADRVYTFAGHGPTSGARVVQTFRQRCSLHVRPDAAARPGSRRHHTALPLPVCCTARHDAPLAQLAEQQTLNLRVQWAARPLPQLHSAAALYPRLS